MSEITTIYTDGGCHGNPGPGGWAYIIDTGAERIENSGYEEETTNNRMELTGVIRALEHISGGSPSSVEMKDTGKITVFTDSQYVQKGISEWIHNWVRNGWKTASKKPVKNADLWKRLKELADNVEPRWEWVRGHAGNEQNERCDELVQAAIKNNSSI